MTDTALAATANYATAPEDRVPRSQKLVCGLGAFVSNLLARAGCRLPDHRAEGARGAPRTGAAPRRREMTHS